MKRLLIASLVAGWSLCAHAMLMNEVRIWPNPPIMPSNPFDWSSKEPPDESTVRFRLMDNTAMRRWEFSVSEHQTGSLDLAPGLDVTLGTELSLQFQMFPKGSPQAVSHMIVQGANLQAVKIDYMTDTIDLTVEPAAPAITASHSMPGYTAGLSIHFYYSGEFVDPETVNYGPPIVATDAFPDDVSWPEHPSSADLKGHAIRINGTMDEAVNFGFIFGSRYMDSISLDFGDVRGYVDGVMSPYGYELGPPVDPGFFIDMGGGAETFSAYHGSNSYWSARDIQVGRLPEPLSILGIVREAGGFRIHWNAAPGRSYTVESSDDITAPFAPLAPDLTSGEYLDTDPPGGSRYYRIREE